MSNIRLDWPGVAVFSVALIAAVVVGVWVDFESALVIAGIAGGFLVKLGAVAVGPKPDSGDDAMPEERS